MTATVAPLETPTPATAAAPRKRWTVAEVEALFLADPKIAVATGYVIADGALGPGLEIEEGQAILARHGFAAPTLPREGG